LKIHHALKETSYLTDKLNIAGFAAIATTIGNYLWAIKDAPMAGRVSMGRVCPAARF
jgi:hypothetical protein